MIDPYNTTVFNAGGLVPSPTYGYGVLNPANSKHYVVNEDQAGGSRTKTNTFTAEYIYNFSAAELKYVAGWSNYRYSSSNDYDFTSRANFNYFGLPIATAQMSDIGQNSRSYSNEVTLTTTQQGGIQAIGGIYQYHEQLEQPIALLDPGQTQLQVPLQLPYLTPAASNPDGIYYQQYAKLKTESYGAFGQVDFPLSDTLTLTTGLRYSMDHKYGQEAIRQILWDPQQLGALSLCCSLDVTPPIDQRTLSDSWSAMTGRLALSWKPNAGTLVYGSLSKGYKAGGFNLGSIAEQPHVGPEKLYAFEAGIKQRVGSTLQINASTFFYSYRDLQVLYDVLRNGVTQTDFVNADRAHSYGAELQTIWAPTSTLSFLLSYSYLNAKFTNFCCITDIASANPTASQNLHGATLPQSPRNKIALDGTYSFSLSRGTLAASAIYSYISPQYFSPFNTDTYRASGFSDTDLRLTWEPTDKRYTVIASVKNVFNAEGFNSLTLQGAYRVVTPYLPRIFGLEFQYRF